MKGKNGIPGKNGEDRIKGKKQTNIRFVSILSNVTIQ